LRAILRGGVADGVVPGISLLLAHRIEVIFRAASGEIALDQKVQMASGAKPVTATLLVILVDRSKLTPDDPVETEFRGIALNGKPPRRGPTVGTCYRTSRAGPAISRPGRSSGGCGAGPGEVAGDLEEARGPFVPARNRSSAQSVRTPAEAGLAIKPGAEFNDGTLGFDVAARLAEAAGRPFEDPARTL
jgi:CubicO group peptidase (beta-lactamase class C family)